MSGYNYWEVCINGHVEKTYRNRKASIEMGKKIAARENYLCLVHVWEYRAGSRPVCIWSSRNS